MFIVDNAVLAIVFCMVTMLGWGSWANTQKLAGKEKWPFALYYWDYGVGVVLMGLVLAFTLGSAGTAGMSAAANLSQAGSGAIVRALAAGALFNVSNILLVVAIDAAGLAVAFPVGVGLALVIGTVTSYIQTPKGDPMLLFGGVALVLLAIVVSAVAHGKLPKTGGRGGAKGVIFAAVAGCLMGFFYPQLMQAISPDFNSGVIQPGYLTPYTALIFFGLGVLLSNFVVNTDRHARRRLARLRLLPGRGVAAHAGHPGRDDLDAGARPERGGLGRCRPGHFLCARPGRHAGGGDLGSCDLEGISRRARGRHAAVDRHVRRLQPGPGAHRLGDIVMPGICTAMSSFLRGLRRFLWGRLSACGGLSGRPSGGGLRARRSSRSCPTWLCCSVRPSPQSLRRSWLNG